MTGPKKIVQLLESMEKSIPSNDRHTFKMTQSVMAWGKVAFKDFSGEKCKLKWLEILCNLRKFCTLKELSWKLRKMLTILPKAETTSILIYPKSP